MQIGVRDELRCWSEAPLQFTHRTATRVRGVRSSAQSAKSVSVTTESHTHTIAKHSTTMVAECESSSVGVKQKACSTPTGAFL